MHPAHRVTASGIHHKVDLARQTSIAVFALASIALIACDAIGAIQAKPEHRPVRVLFDALVAYDNASLASTVPPGARTDNPGRDAERALAAALKGSELDWLANDLPRRIGNLSGTTIAVSSLELETEGRVGDVGWVLARGKLDVLRDGRSFLQTRFSARVPVIRVDEQWYIRTSAP